MYRHKGYYFLEFPAVCLFLVQNFFSVFFFFPFLSFRHLLLRSPPPPTSPRVPPCCGYCRATFPKSPRENFPALALLSRSARPASCFSASYISSPLSCTFSHLSIFFAPRFFESCRLKCGLRCRVASRRRWPCRPSLNSSSGIAIGKRKTIMQERERNSGSEM